ncbi:MAG: methyltransferase [Nitrososphaerota archaeon]|jgi:16S rRNA G1207 methylase RsmC|nr:methyltransferase [Nitrososphaerota archaeon]
MSKKNKSQEHYFSSAPKSDECFGIIRASLRGRNFEFMTSASVFSKKKVDLGTHVLVDAMVLPQKGSVLDIGCGYGVVGITAATSNSKLHVVMTDVNMRAVRLAKQNLQTNHIKNAEVRHGDLYEPVLGLIFDCVLSNPPVSAGMDVVKAIIEGAPQMMVPGGSFQMVIRSKIGAKILPETFCNAFGNCEVLARESGYRVLMGKLSV